MRIQILGTAASEGWPAVFCGCETCMKVRATGGKNVRSRASLQIDDIYKIDMGPDTYWQGVRFGINYSKLAAVFFTHSHNDHFSRDYIGYFHPPFAHNLANAPVNIYGNSAIIGAIESSYPDNKYIELHTAEPFIPIKAGDLTFTPIIAEHMQSEQCLNYIIQSKSGTVLYSSDTGAYKDKTIEFLKRQKFDLLILECTHGPERPGYPYHMGMPIVRELREILAQAGSITAATPVVVTHFSHNMGLLHDEFQAMLEPEGITVAYDGIMLDV